MQTNRLTQQPVCANQAGLEWHIGGGRFGHFWGGGGVGGGLFVGITGRSVL